MPQIKNVAISGAAGYLGSSVLHALVSDGSFNITVLRRPLSTSTILEDIRIVNVDHESIADLTKVLQGQDALIMTTASLAVLSQLPLIEAAAAAGVYRLIPSDFGSDLTKPNVRKLDYFAAKCAVDERLHEEANAGRLTYTHIHNGAFIPYALNGFLFNIEDPFVVDGGNTVFSASTTETVGNAVVGVLRNLKETENKILYIEDFKLTQNKLLDFGKQIDSTRSWEPRQLNLVEMRAEAAKKRAEGVKGRSTFLPDLFTSLLDPASGPDFQRVDNRLLGLKPKSEDVVIAHLKALVEQGRETAH